MVTHHRAIRSREVTHHKGATQRREVTHHRVGTRQTREGTSHRLEAILSTRGRRVTHSTSEGWMCSIWDRGEDIKLYFLDSMYKDGPPGRHYFLVVFLLVLG